jgi:hypothetical protein
MFHLGTRMPSMQPRDLQNWDLVYPPALKTVDDQYNQQQYPSYFSEVQDAESGYSKPG